MIKVVLVSDVQQGDSVIRTHASFLFQILFLTRLLQIAEQSSLCYTEGYYCFFLIEGSGRENIYFIPDSRDSQSKRKLEKKLSKNPN